MFSTGIAVEQQAAWSSTRNRAAAAPQSRALDGWFAHAPVHQLKSQQPLFAEGDIKSSVFRVESGAVLIYRILNDGYRQVVRFAFPGDFVGLEFEDTHAHDAQAIGPTRVRCVPAPWLMRRAAEDPELARELYRSLSCDVLGAHDHLFMIGRLNATGRLASFLITLSQRNAQMGLDPVNISLPVRRCDIADFLCVSVETVSRSLAELKLARIVSLAGWRQIKLLNWHALADMAAGAQPPQLRYAA